MLRSKLRLYDLDISVVDERFTSWNVMTSLFVNALTLLSQSQSYSASITAAHLLARRSLSA